MKHQELIDAITKVAEDNGWRVSVEEAKHWNSENHKFEGKSDVIDFTFGRYSDADQDFSFSVEMSDGDVETLIEKMTDYYESYDPDEEAMLWVDNDGHGKNGAPYRLSDIVKDMEECESNVRELLYAIDEASRKGEFDELEED